MSMEQDYKNFHKYTDYYDDGHKNRPLFEIFLNINDYKIYYDVAVNDDIITESHRTIKMQQEINYSDFDSAMYFNLMGTHL